MTQRRFANAIVIATSLIVLAACDGVQQGDALQSPKAVPSPSATPPAATTGMPPAAPLPSTPAAGADSLPSEEWITCEKTQEGFSSFFSAFVMDDRMRAAHIAQTVEIRRYDDPAKLIGRETVMQVEPFKVTLGSDYRWTLVTPGPRGPVLGAVLDLSIEVEADVAKVEFVRAEYGQDEDLLRTFGPRMGYLFEFKDRCWQLTEELR